MLTITNVSERETPKVRSKEFGSVVSSKMHKLKYIKGMKSADKKKTRGGS